MKKLIPFIKDILPLLPLHLRKIITAEPFSVQKEIEEIRLVVGRPIYLSCQGREVIPGSWSGSEVYLVDREDIRKILQIVSKFSLYAFEEEIRQGYITVPGGHRLGLAGKTVVDKDKVRYLRSISSLNIRIARQVLGSASVLLPYLVDSKTQKIFHTLVISPPKSGKTTLLRDLARLISGGNSFVFPRRVGIIDERSELAGSFQGIPQLDVGPRTDVLDACPKAVGMMMFICSMSPAVLITDEIGREEDVFALREVLNAGIVVITSAHARNYTELCKRAIMVRILEEKIFERIVILGNSCGVGTVESLLDENGKELWQERGTTHVS